MQKKRQAAGVRVVSTEALFILTHTPTYTHHILSVFQIAMLCTDQLWLFGSVRPYAKEGKNSYLHNFLLLSLSANVLVVAVCLAVSQSNVLTKNEVAHTTAAPCARACFSWLASPHIIKWNCFLQRPSILLTFSMTLYYTWFSKMMRLSTTLVALLVGSASAAVNLDSQSEVTAHR